ncbi:nuclease-related domain-containing protein [Planococcus lenghuensis]|uniref:NERD domain-containing protein n=1 Tax=Planococcus lenghuensis TaxID=2213202 RepID=A0A1Q2L0J3_9BACL|nr:nuclease-related domain-containing protein [Planococcus lenghuensis]AQQ53951.1 hypothetical protein B0X71_13175 [Planococcus lenghuensis]
MLVKMRGEPADKERLEVLMRRFPGSDALEKEYQSVCAGVGGEERFDYYMEQCEPKFPHLILHDVSLESVFPFQLDSVMITPWCIYVFEVKNLGGRTQIRQNPQQAVQLKEDGSRAGIKSPLEQMETHSWLFEEWLMRHKLIVPLRSILVFSYAKQIPENIPSSQVVLFSHQLPLFMSRLAEEAWMMHPAEMQKIADELIRFHRPFVHPPFHLDKRFPISRMKTGVWCNACGRLGMKRLHGCWICGCGAKEKAAHERTVRDWLLITGEPITNRDAREMLGLTSVHAAGRLLRSMDLERIGTFRDSKYLLKR